MGSLGIGEIILILIVAAVVLGPDKLPDMAKKAGRTVRDFRQELQGMEASVKKDVDEVVDLSEVEALRKEVEDLKRELQGKP